MEGRLQSFAGFIWTLQSLTGQKKERKYVCRQGSWKIGRYRRLRIGLVQLRGGDVDDDDDDDGDDDDDDLMLDEDYDESELIDSFEESDDIIDDEDLVMGGEDLDEEGVEEEGEAGDESEREEDHILEEDESLPEAGQARPLVLKGVEEDEEDEADESSWDEVEEEDPAEVADAKARLELEMENRYMVPPVENDFDIPQFSARSYFIEIMEPATFEDIPEEYDPDFESYENASFPASLYDIEGIADIDRNPFDMSRLRGKVVLVVNVASNDDRSEEEYAILKDLHAKFSDSGFDILAFPSNMFGQKEPGTNEEVKRTIQEKFSPEFPIMSKCNPNDNEIFWLGKRDFPGKVIWNFQAKILFDKDGQPVRRYNRLATLEEMGQAIEELLAGTTFLA